MLSIYTDIYILNWVQNEAHCVPNKRSLAVATSVNYHFQRAKDSLCVCVILLSCRRSIVWMKNGFVSIKPKAHHRKLTCVRMSPFTQYIYLQYGHTTIKPDIKQQKIVYNIRFCSDFKNYALRYTIHHCWQTKWQQKERNKNNLRSQYTRFHKKKKKSARCQCWCWREDTGIEKKQMMKRQTLIENQTTKTQKKSSNKR